MSLSSPPSPASSTASAASSTARRLNLDDGDTYTHQAIDSPYDDEPPVAEANNNRSRTNNDYEDDDDDDDESTNPLSEDNIGSLFLEVETFMKALQDMGAMKTKKSKQVYEYKGLKTLAGAFYNKWKDSKLINMGENKSRTVNSILSVLLRMRNAMDVHEVLPSLQSYALPGKEQMFIIQNDDTGGQEQIISACVARFGKAKKKASEARNASIAVRLAACLCHPSIRAAAKNWLAKKKDRNALDQSYSTELAFGELLLALFEDETLEIVRPDVMDLPNHDPNNLINPKTCEFKNRDVKWILATWKEYLKPKYQMVLRKWYKQTGGGGRALEDFIKYCNARNGSPMPFLVWVYAIDTDADHLLASSSAGQPPSFITQEAGFEVEDNTSPSGGSAETPRKRKADAVQALVEESGARVDKILSIVEAQAASKAESDPIHSRLKMMDDVSSAKSAYAQDNDLTPNTKAEFLNALTTKKKSIATEIIDISKKRKANDE